MDKGTKKPMSTGVKVSIAIGVVVIIVVVIIIIVYAAGGFSSSSETSTTPTTTAPLAAAVPIAAPLARQYQFVAGTDSMWTGKENALSTLPFTSIDDSKKICDTLPGCKGFVLLKGKAYYRPIVAATPTVWPASAGATATDGTWYTQ